MKSDVRKIKLMVATFVLMLGMAAGAYFVGIVPWPDSGDGQGSSESAVETQSSVPDNGAAESSEKAEKTTNLLLAARRKELAAIGQRHKESVSTRPLHPFPNIPKSRRGLSLEDDPFAPISQADQDWLDRHGYPNAMQWQEYQTANAAVLEQAAAAGDTVAETYLNLQKLQGGDSQAEASLLYSGALGNDFAIEMLASVFGGTGKRAEPVEANALSRVLEMRGQVGHGIRELFYPVQLDPLQRMEAEVRAVQYYNLLVEVQREAQGPNAVVFDPRPITGGG